jgi:hypothetical protein
MVDLVANRDTLSPFGNETEVAYAAATARYILFVCGWCYILVLWVLKQEGGCQRNEASNTLQCWFVLSGGEDNGQPGGNRGGRESLRSDDSAVGNAEGEDTPGRGVVGSV